MSAEKPIIMSSGDAIDLSHHLSTAAKLHKLSPLKGLQKYQGRPGMISLAGGMPDPAYFPFASISGEALVPESFPKNKPSESSMFKWFWSMFGARSKEKTERLTIPKYAKQKGDVNLAAALQYSPATGLQPLQDFIHEFAGKVFRPGYSNWRTLVHTGNTDGIYKTLVTLCDPREMILVAEWAYASLFPTIQPMGVTPASVKIDGQGMSSVDLEHVLSEWDEKARGAKRPHVLYTVPIGQNPTGATMGTERKKAIYEICVKYDIIILEDDPYYFLQEGVYSPKSERVKSATASRYAKGEGEETHFINSLTPSFVRYDYQGRVIRLDTFSKIIAPGSRLGWFTCNSFFAERLERQAETTTQMPCGFSQSLITQLIAKHWGFKKFIRWIQGLQTQYTIRRDFFVDCIFEEFELRPSSDPALAAMFGGGKPVLTAYVKTQGTQGMQEKGPAENMPLFSFVPPTSGLFVWLKCHISGDAKTGGNEPEGQSIDEQVWTDLAEHGVLVVGGWIFDTIHGGDPHSAPTPREMNFRLSFSLGEFEDMKAGVKILAQVLSKYVRQ